MSAHRFWRLYVTQSQNSSRNILLFKTLEFRASIGGPSICTGGSAIASGAESSYPAAHAFDGNDATSWYLLGTDAPVWIGYDLGYGNAAPVEEIAIDASGYSAPSSFSLQHSDDGIIWTTLKSWTALSQNYFWSRAVFSIHWSVTATAGVSTPFDYDHTDPGPHRFWRLLFTRSNFAGWSDSNWCSGETNYPVANRIEFRAVCDGPSICTGGTPFGGPESDEFGYAFDDNPESGWGAIDTNDCKNPVWIGYDLGEGQSSLVAEIAYVPSRDLPNTPNCFSLQYSDDGEFWHIFKAWQNLGIEEWTPYQPKILATGPIQYARAGIETSYPVGGETTSAHRFWRLHITASTRPYVNDIVLLNLRLRAVAEGPTICINGVADASENPLDAEWVFAEYGGWSALSFGGEVWISYDLGEGVASEVIEVLITPLYANRAPADFSLQYSDDGLTWAILKRWVGLTSRDWADEAEKLLTIDALRTSAAAFKIAYHIARTDAPAHRFWRLFMTSGSFGEYSYVDLAKLEFRSVAGGPSICVAGTPIASANVEQAGNVFDDEIGEDSEFDWTGSIGGWGWWGGDAWAPLWIGYDLGAGRAFAVSEMVIVVRDPGDAPAVFSLHYSDDGLEWWPLKSWEVDPWIEWLTPEGEPENPLIAKTFHVEPLVFFSPVIGAPLTTRYGVFTASALVQPQTFGAGRTLTTPFSFMRVAATALATPYGSAVVATSGLITPAAILDYNPAGVGLVTLYRIIDSDRPAVVPPLDPHLIHNTRRIELASAEIYMAEGDYGWSGSAAIASLADFQSLGVDDSVTLMLGETGFSLLVDSRSVSRGADSVGLTVSLVSATAALSAPRAALVSMTPDSLMTARQAAESAIGAIEWSMLDWPIPPGRIAFHDAAPMAIAEAMAGAAGGVIETLPDGRLRARHRFPIRVPDWPDAVPDHTLTEETILSIQESYRHLTRVDRVVVRDWQPNDSGRLAIEPDSRPMGLNRGSPNLYPGALVHLLVHASPDISNVTLTASAGKLWPGELQQWKETVDLVFADKATVTLPAQVISLDAFHWLGPDLDALTLDADGITVTAARSGLSVARVKVTRRAMAWLFKAPRLLAGETQFPVVFVATATDGDSRAAGEITALRGEGLHPGDDILEPLASHVDARRERGRAVIDAEEPLQEVTVATLFNADLLPGQLIEVNDAAMGVPWRGKAKSVRHSVGDFPITTLDLVRHVPAR
ncbi:MAG: discoidin domain-containing protein [Magnetococcales bacterium]|nr:discoidin domain-containing protein [Magnetococcales bacterium]